MFITLILSVGISLPIGAHTQDVRETVKKGLKWLADQQAKDGSWTGRNGMYPAAMTGFAGVALLMEESTLNEGTYAANLRLAVAWFEKNTQKNGLLIPVGDESEQNRYMLSQAFGLLFLACAYDTDDDSERRERLRNLLAKAVKFAGDSQTSRGGWGYVSASDGSDFDEGYVTISVLRSLIAARNAGIDVPSKVIDKGVKYLINATNREGGVLYSLVYADSTGPARPVLTAAAATTAFMLGGRPPEPLPRWIMFANKALPTLRPGRLDWTAVGHHYYMSRIAYTLGDSGHRALDPEAKEQELVKWTRYRANVFPLLMAGQAADGSWVEATIGPVYTTSMVLTILQLENNYLPAFSR